MNSLLLGYKETKRKKIKILIELVSLDIDQNTYKNLYCMKVAFLLK